MLVDKLSKESVAIGAREDEKDDEEEEEEEEEEGGSRRLALGPRRKADGSC